LSPSGDQERDGRFVLWLFFIAEETKKWGKVIRAANIKSD